MHDVDVFYISLPVDSPDEATSLSDYLTRHGVCAVCETDAVTCPMEDPADTATVHQLSRNWRRYWEHWDSGLFGAPMFVKPDCQEGCPHCGR